MPMPTSTNVHRRGLRFVLPILVAVALGTFGGLGVFTFGYGDGHAYLRDDPQTCANCHIMRDAFDSWTKSTHHAVAVCNDCHTPHDSILAKYVTKADNGFFHSLAFTTGNFKDPIQIKERNSRIVQAACVDCHREFVNPMLSGHETEAVLSCVHCHFGAGHASSVAARRYPGY